MFQCSVPSHRVDWAGRSHFGSVDLALNLFAPRDLLKPKWKEVDAQLLEMKLPPRGLVPAATGGGPLQHRGLVPAATGGGPLQLRGLVPAATGGGPLPLAAPCSVAGSRSRPL